MADPPRARTYPSPAAQRRSGELWRARLGLVLVSVVLIATGVTTLGLLRLVRAG